MDQLDELKTGETRTSWLWDGMIGRGSITLLVSKWKSGKTTLLAGLLRTFEMGGTFLDRAVAPARALIVSEEPIELWSIRRRSIPIGSHVRLLSRPFASRPTRQEWDELVRYAESERASGRLDLFIVDTLISFLPGRSDCNSGPILDMLLPLRRLSAVGVAVLVLHHSRRQTSDDGCAARGSSSLLGFVDVILELCRHGSLAADAFRRRIVAFSRHGETPPAIVYEWTPGTADFRVVPDVLMTRYRENWPVLEAILTSRTEPSTHRELLLDWPPGSEPPSPSTLYEWLARAMKDSRVVRTGAGTRNSPYRFELNWATRVVELPEYVRLQLENMRAFARATTDVDDDDSPRPIAPSEPEIVS